MRNLIFLLLIFIPSLVFSQTKSGAVKIQVELSPLYEKITLKFSSAGNSPTLYITKIVDDRNNVLKIHESAVSGNLFVTTIPILDLPPGNYTCVIYKGKEEVYKENFFKDAILSEPQPEPVLRESKK